MFGAWDGPEIATFWIAIGAAVISLLSVCYTRREAHAVEGALKLKKQREVERRRPEIAVRFDDWAKPSAILNFALENRGGIVVDRANVQVRSGDDDARLIGFGDDTALGDRGREFGPLKPGVPVTDTFIVSDKDFDEPKIKFLITCKAGDDEWSKLVEADLPPHPPFAAFA